MKDYWLKMAKDFFYWSNRTENTSKELWEQAMYQALLNWVMEEDVWKAS